MDFTLKASQTTVTDAIRTAFEDKLSTLEPLLQRESKVHVELQEDTKHRSGRFPGWKSTLPHMAITPKPAAMTFTKP